MLSVSQSVACRPTPPEVISETKGACSDRSTEHITTNNKPQSIRGLIQFPQKLQTTVQWWRGTGPCFQHRPSTSADHLHMKHTKRAH